MENIIINSNLGMHDIDHHHIGIGQYMFIFGGIVILKLIMDYFPSAETLP